MKRIEFTGNLVKTAEVFTPNNTSNRSVINFLVAVNDKQKDGSNKVMFIDCAYWKPKDKVEVAKWLTKGVLVFCEGEPSLDIYTDKEGKSIAKLKVDIKGAIGVELLGGKKPDSQNTTTNSGNGNQRPATTHGNNNNNNNQSPDDDLPF